jgi:hypothetical protein
MKRRALILALLLAGCGEDKDAPYVEYMGGGFIFNYRTADHFYGFVIRPLRSLPEGAVLEVEFEVPGKDGKIVQREPVREGQLQYKFQTPSLRGIVKDHRYRTQVRLIGKDGGLLGTVERSFYTSLDQSKLPGEPLTTGPAYNPNPAAQ